VTVPDMQWNGWVVWPWVCMSDSTAASVWWPMPECLWQMKL
jgi:hypothetical protein